ncbi:unnamed protein product, partial [Pylaiella littoralis]
MSSFFVDGQFTDAWIVDRALFEHLSGGACSCCGITRQERGALMQGCSDIETDDGRQEGKSPWPAAMSDAVWTARVKLRAIMKEDMPQYNEFWEKHAQGFSTWWKGLSAAERREILSMPVNEVSAAFQGKYDLRGAYSVVMSAVNEQVRNFDKTGIKGDSRTAAELSFEESLKVDRGAYVGKMFVSDTHAKQFFDLCKQVGGPRLLPSKPRGRGADLSLESNGPVASVHRPSSQDVNNVEVDATKTEGQSFRADRRLVRLVVFRYMFDKAIRKYRA